MSTLQHVGVTAGYRHAEKIVRSEPSFALEGATLKWYDIAPENAPVPLALQALARRNLRDAARERTLGELGELGFVILHRCGESFYFLLVSTWRNENELWETVWAKEGDGDVFFRPWPTDGAHRPTFCVWELAAVDHERQAWTRFLRSPRDEEAKRAYLRSAYDGVA
jgi:hypothetical protein